MPQNLTLGQLLMILVTILIFFYKMSNLKMNTIIDFYQFSLGESNGLKELHIKYLE